MAGADRANRTTDQIKVAIESSVGVRREMLARRKSGSTFPVDLAISRVDHLDIYIGILRDISDQKKLQAHVLEIASDEQRRIGQELHDGIQQEMTGLSLFAGALSSFLDKAKPTDASDRSEWTLSNEDYQRAVQACVKITQGLKDANHHVRDLSHGIMPVQIDAEGLRSALAELASATNEIDQVRCLFEFTGSSPIANNSIATQLYRIAQESISNALKHGLADDITISLNQQDFQVILEVSDNGIGYEPRPTPTAPSGRGGKGIQIMLYRASMLGGDLHIGKNAGGGTIVRCTVPATGGFL
jgi:signal transduction histidine kinase